MKAYKGNIVYAESKGTLSIHENAYLLVKNGKIVGIDDTCPTNYENLEIIDFKDNLIIPGLVDIHLHAPQINNLGLGVDMELLDWLNTYTFPEESKFNNLEYAEKSYKRLINMIWENGTTSSVIFGSLYNNSNILLARLFEESGLKSYIGKVNMDRNSPDFYIENTEQSLIDTEDYINAIKDLKRVNPIITPRFVPSCTSELMKGLGDLAKNYNLKIQSHLSENRSEIDWVKELHPDCETYIDVYEKYNLLKKDETIMAHCVFSKGKELEKLRKYNVMVAHAPMSNGNLASGIAPIHHFLDNDINVGICSDISGGNDLNIAKNLTLAETFGKLKWVEENNNLSYLNTADYFYMATGGGGSFFGNVGTFKKGYDADFLVIDDEDLNDFNERTIEERLKRYLYNGSTKNIVKRFVLGKDLKKPFNI